MMRRRAFIAGLGSAVAWPVVARAQQRMPVVGCLMNTSQEKADYIVAPFLQGLTDTGFTEGRNLKIEYRWADGHNERLEALAAELVNMQVSVLAVPGGASGALAAKRLTTTIPIVS